MTPASINATNNYSSTANTREAAPFPFPSAPKGLEASCQRDGKYPKTTQGLVDVLHGPDCPLRQAHVAWLVQCYQPILQNVVGEILREKRKGGFKMSDIPGDLTGDEITKMLDPDKGYFRLYDHTKGRLRTWIKTRICNKTSDLLKSYALSKRGDMEEIDWDQLEAQIDDRINVEEMHALFQHALRVTKKHFIALGEPEKFEVFINGSSKNPEESNGQTAQMSEWQRRNAKSEVKNFIRDTALPQAAALVSDQPDDACELAKSTWDALKNKNTITRAA